jgi:hypothetical protein
MICGVSFVLTRDPEGLAARASDWLAERIERNVLATVLMNVLDGHHGSGVPVLAYGLDGNGEQVSAARRVPPWPLLASELDTSDAAEFVELWLNEDPHVPGVNGLPVTARAIAHAWAQRTGGRTSRRMREAMHVLTTVRDPQRPASGPLRLAQPTERSLLLDWMRDFAVEAGVIGGAQADAMVDTRLDRQHLFVWEDGEPLSDDRDLARRRRSRTDRPGLHASRAPPARICR